MDHHLGLHATSQRRRPPCTQQRRRPSCNQSASTSSLDQPLKLISNNVLELRSFGLESLLSCKQRAHRLLLSTPRPLSDTLLRPHPPLLPGHHLLLRLRRPQDLHHPRLPRRPFRLPFPTRRPLLPRRPRLAQQIRLFPRSSSALPPSPVTTVQCSSPLPPPGVASSTSAAISPLKRESCPFNLAPVTSAAILMVFGGTVAVALMRAKNLTKEVYATNHPSGKIGKSLVFKVKDLMLPLCKEGDMIMDQLVELTSKGCGCLLVINDENHLVGAFTDGDLRRALKASKEGIFQRTVGEMCNRYIPKLIPGEHNLELTAAAKSRSPRTIDPNALAVEAMKIMESPPSPVQFLPVVDHQNVVIGIITLHGLVSAGL